MCKKGTKYRQTREKKISFLGKKIFLITKVQSLNCLLLLMKKKSVLFSKFLHFVFFTLTFLVVT